MKINTADKFWVGFDPGGVNKFGAAIINENECVRIRNLSSVDDAVAFVRCFFKNFEPMGVGIDAPLWWSGGEGGGRQVDRLIRKRYSISSGTVQSSNSLRGAAVVQAPLLIERLRAIYPNLFVTEAHPKAYLRGPHKNDLGYLRGLDFGSHDPDDDDHQRDAILAAIAAREGQLHRWKFDLSLIRQPEEQDPKTYWLAPVHYFWPECITDEP
ncbi:hypothetical protein AAFO92_02585 [Roseovarius sp. CAU 1744]|uniref:hypothetical protein n=1 Tax=Roseovarius sp. CAU 1744 TaxID=3140368 RepID=UPI00325BBD03